MNRKIITVQELIDKLNKIEDKTRPVFIHPIDDIKLEELGVITSISTIRRVDLNAAPLVVE